MGQKKHGCVPQTVANGVTSELRQRGQYKISPDFLVQSLGGDYTHNLKNNQLMYVFILSNNVNLLDE